MSEYNSFEKMCDYKSVGKICNYDVVRKLGNAMESLREAAGNFTNSEIQDFKTRQTIKLILRTEQRV